jgi:hypothetical protein
VAGSNAGDAGPTGQGLVLLGVIVVVIGIAIWGLFILRR